MGQRSPTSPHVTVDGDGNATAIWSEETGDASVVRTRTRPKGGAWARLST